MQKKIELKGEELILDADKALYWPRYRTLILTDLHFGKVGHFHKQGIAIPFQVVGSDYERLDKLNDRYSIETWLCLGDLFHSHWNQECPLFQEWRSRHPDQSFILIEGNHDRYSRKYLDTTHLLSLTHLEMPPFYFIHDWKDRIFPENLYPLSGHLHPAVKLYGKGRQTLRLPCFWFGEKGGYLPAFGQFTGTSLVEPQEGDRIYATLEEELIEINT